MRNLFHALAIALLLSACPAVAEEDFLANFVLGDKDRAQCRQMPSV
jgi:hypothetical protein